jgi:hypothetical protein
MLGKTEKQLAELRALFECKEEIVILHKPKVKSPEAIKDAQIESAYREACLKPSSRYQRQQTGCRYIKPLQERDKSTLNITTVKENGKRIVRVSRKIS